MNNDLERIEEARDIIISAIAQTMVMYGLTPSVGRIYGVLYFAKKPMSLNEIKDAVAMSKGSVSNGLRDLLESEMIIKVWQKGDRKDYYIAERDFAKNFLNFLIKNMRLERNLILKANDKVQPVLEDIAENPDSAEAKEEAKNDLKLLEQSREYFDWTKRIIDALESGEIFEYFPMDKK
ncbi:GbsR/MarR family transcriptional regulator [Natranaerobius thermophilus]|uniref:HTH-type transcriptional regulator n=1 Tax=Natranaerobius thermophilus (strain ATCC BAA-1301 / DSM 18059 / JW/NM-WN-LF) TaxID=457570 RepID=B2A5Y4_NATTJ|nr:transcriptional regulator [Natranaerobius thermophilus]ACB85401.1 putative transcriptional regulator [Natranaerobius thermophilus JW/NM-WN-LF]